jgi:hypothetical protein
MQDPSFAGTLLAFCLDMFSPATAAEKSVVTEHHYLCVGTPGIEDKCFEGAVDREKAG